MVRVGLLVRLQAKPGKEAEVASFLESGLALANQEAATVVWFALRLGPSTFGIFDAFPMKQVERLILGANCGGSDGEGRRLVGRTTKD